MPTVELKIPTLGNRFVDYRDDILGDSYNFGPVLQANKVKYFAFHHSVTTQTAKTDGNWKKECDVIASLHVNGNGWDGIGYRFVICSNGVVAYVGDLSHGGAAVANHNDVIISAVMIGDFTKHLPTDAQIQSAHDLAKWFLEDMPQYPLIVDWDKNVIGHKDAAKIFNEPSIATACPGISWPDDMKWRIKTKTIYTPPSPTPTPVPPTPVPPTTDWKKKYEDEVNAHTATKEAFKKYKEDAAVAQADAVKDALKKLNDKIDAAQK